MMIGKAITMAAAIALAGCAGSPFRQPAEDIDIGEFMTRKEVAPHIPPVPDHQSRKTWRVGAAEMPGLLAGAAYRPAAKLHVLMTDPLKSTNGGGSQPGGAQAGADAAASAASRKEAPAAGPDGRGRKAGRSPATHQDTNRQVQQEQPSRDRLREAWEKYCNGGVGLSETDWALLSEAGAPRSVPPDLAERCVHPK